MAGPVDLSKNKWFKKPNKTFRAFEGELIIGDNVHIAPFCVIQAHGGFCMGNNSGFSSGVKIYTLSNHPINPSEPSSEVHFTPLSEKAVYIIGPVVLEENVGVALNSVILSGVTVGRDSFVTPFSFVNRSFESNSVISGIPAKREKPRFPDNAVLEEPL
jgi:galactoside O-acetyltransferase